jgi:hypothetical protein
VELYIVKSLNQAEHWFKKASSKGRLIIPLSFATYNKLQKLNSHVNDIITPFWLYMKETKHEVILERSRKTVIYINKKLVDDSSEIVNTLLFDYLIELYYSISIIEQIFLTYKNKINLIHLESNYDIIHRAGGKHKQSDVFEAVLSHYCAINGIKIKNHFTNNIELSVNRSFNVRSKRIYYILRNLLFGSVLNLYHYASSNKLFSSKSFMLFSFDSLGKIDIVRFNSIVESFKERKVDFFKIIDLNYTGVLDKRSILIPNYNLIIGERIFKARLDHFTNDLLEQLYKDKHLHKFIVNNEYLKAQWTYIFTELYFENRISSFFKKSIFRWFNINSIIVNNLMGFSSQKHWFVLAKKRNIKRVFVPHSGWLYQREQLIVEADYYVVWGRIYKSLVKSFDDRETFELRNTHE